MAGVVLEGVSRVFTGGIAAVENVSLEVQDRELLVLVGPSGCGKSTTLRLIAGLEEPSSGQIRIGERVVNRVTPKDRDVAMVFQSYALYPHLTVYRNMAFGLQLRSGAGWLRRSVYRVLRPAKGAELAQRRRQIDEQVRSTAQLLEIDALLDRLPRQLSGGERQRVALGRAIVRQPAVFLFDEPLSNLDARLRVEMRRLLKQLHQRLRTTTVYVTHDQAEALTLGERIAVMDRGRLQQIGAPLDVYDRPENRFVAGFIGTPPMNFIEGSLAEVDGSWVFQRDRLAWPLSQRPAAMTKQKLDGSVVLGIRPEHVSIEQSGGLTDRPTRPGTAQGTVAVVEPLGDSTVVELVLDDKFTAGGGPNGVRQEHISLTSKVEARSNLRVGDRVQFVFDMRRAHVFDQQTGLNLSRDWQAA